MLVVECRCKIGISSQASRRPVMKPSETSVGNSWSISILPLDGNYRRFPTSLTAARLRSLISVALHAFTSLRIMTSFFSAGLRGCMSCGIIQKCAHVVRQPSLLVKRLHRPPDRFSRSVSVLQRQSTKPLIMLHSAVARPLSSTASALVPHVPRSAINTTDPSPSTSTPMTALAMSGSNQLSLETPKNGAGQFSQLLRKWSHHLCPALLRG